MRKTLKALLVAALAALALAACSSSSSDTTDAGGSGAEVSVVNFGFEASDVTVAVGESVTWTNNSSATHTSTATDDSWNVQLNAGDSHTETFASAGTFDYFCAIHPAMTGTVTVNG